MPNSSVCPFIPRDRAERLKRTLARTHFQSDAANPRLLLQGAHIDVLKQLAAGQLDARALACYELASRGLNEHGAWVGFNEARLQLLAGVSV